MWLFQVPFLFIFHFNFNNDSISFSLVIGGFESQTWEKKLTRSIVDPHSNTTFFHKLVPVAPSVRYRRRYWPVQRSTSLSYQFEKKMQYFDWCFSLNSRPITTSISELYFKLFTSLNTKMIVSII